MDIVYLTGLVPTQNASCHKNDDNDKVEDGKCHVLKNLKRQNVTKIHLTT